jgi:Ni2+-binding GTPase involved in maturation of urease and hydrogenase
LPHTNFRVERITADLRRLAPKALLFQVSARTGDGLGPLVEWLMGKLPKSVA